MSSEGSNFHCDVGRLADAVVVFRFQFVTNSPPETGASTPKGEGVDKPLISPFLPPFSFLLSHFLPPSSFLLPHFLPPHQFII